MKKLFLTLLLLILATSINLYSITNYIYISSIQNEQMMTDAQIEDIAKTYHIKFSNPDSITPYERKVDSLYQINVMKSIKWGERLKTDPNAEPEEPAIWFLDWDGNAYDYPPYFENDSILKEREVYQKKLDSLKGKQFQDFDR